MYITAVQIGFERQRKKQLSKIASVKPYGSMPVCVPPEFGVLGSPQPMNANVPGVRYGGGGEGEGGGGEGGGGGAVVRYTANRKFPPMGTPSGFHKYGPLQFPLLYEPVTSPVH